MATRKEQLKLDREKAVKQQEAIENAADGDAGMTAEQWAEYQELTAKIEEIDAAIKLADEQEAAIAKNRKARQSQPRSRGASSPAKAEANVKGEGFEQDPKAGFASNREFFATILDSAKAGVVDDPRLKFLAAGSDEQSTFADPYGGYLVPKGFMPDLKMLQAERDPTAPLTMKVPMSSASVDIPARTDKNHTNSVSGGLRVYRRAESDTVSSSRMETELIGLKLHTLYGISYSTRELLQRSPISIAALLEQGFRDEFGAKILDEKLRGSGVGMMEGVIANNPSTVSIAKESGQAAATIVGANIRKMRARCWGYGQAVWLANHDTYPQLSTAHIAGTNGDVFLYAPGNGTDVPDTLLGRPVFYTEFCETLGTVGDLVLGNWSQYLEATSGGVMSESSMHVRFLEHEETFKFWTENDGRCWWRSALTVKKGSNSLSPFITLATRS